MGVCLVGVGCHGEFQRESGNGVGSPCRVPRGGVLGYYRRCKGIPGENKIDKGICAVCSCHDYECGTLLQGGDRFRRGGDARGGILIVSCVGRSAATTMREGSMNSVAPESEMP